MITSIIKNKIWYIFIILTLFYCDPSNCQSTWSTMPTGVKIVGWSIVVVGLGPCIPLGNTLSTGINIANFSGNGAQNTITYTRSYYGLGIGITDDLGGFECLIEIGVSNKGAKQSLSGYHNLPVWDPTDKLYHDQVIPWQTADKLGELDLNYWRFAIIPKVIIRNQSFIAPIISFGISFEFPNIMREPHGGLVVERHDSQGNIYNGILSGDSDHFVFLNWDLIGGLGFDITVNDGGERRRIFGFEGRYNYGLRSIYKNDSGDIDKFKLRDNTFSILLHVYFPSLMNIIHGDYDSRVY